MHAPYLLQFFIGEVDTELLKAVVFETFESENIQTMGGGEEGEKRRGGGRGGETKKGRVCVCVHDQRLQRWMYKMTQLMSIIPHLCLSHRPPPSPLSPGGQIRDEEIRIKIPGAKY